MANVPKKISTGNRTVVGNQVLNAGDSLVEREQLNRILKGVDQRLEALGVRIDNIPSGGSPGDGASYELSADPSNFSLENVGGNSWFLDILPGGIGTVDLADLSVTYDKIDFTTFDSDDIVEGTTNLYFTDERAQDAVGMILVPGTFVDLIYDDVTPDITADLSATGTPSSESVLRGDNTWAKGVTSDWTAGSYIVGNVRYFPLAIPVSGEINVAETGVDYGAAHAFLTSPGAWDITGIIGGDPGREFTISNDQSSTGSLTLANDAATFPVNYIKTPDGGPYEITAGNSVTLRYVFDSSLADPGYWIFVATTGGGGGTAGALRPKTNDIEAVTGDVRFVLNRFPAEDQVYIYKDGIRMFQSQFTGTGMYRYLDTPASGGEIFTFDYFTTETGLIADTYMDAMGVVVWMPDYPDGTVGIPYDYTPAPASGGISPYTYSLVGTIPDGLTFDSSDGRLYGTPTTEEVASFTAYAEDSDTPPSTSPGFADSVEIGGAGDPYWANVSSLLYGTSATADETGRTWSVAGTIVPDPTKLAFGLPMLHVTAPGLLSLLADDNAFDVGADDWTYEMVIEFGSTGTQALFSKRAGGAAFGGILPILLSGKLHLLATTSGSAWDVNFGDPTSIVVGQRYQVGYRRIGNSWQIWKDNVMVASQTVAGTVPDNVNDVQISEASFPLSTDTWFAQERFTKGIARDLSVAQMAPWPNY